MHDALTENRYIRGRLRNVLAFILSLRNAIMFTIALLLCMKNHVQWKGFGDIYYKRCGFGKVPQIVPKSCGNWSIGTSFCLPWIVWAFRVCWLSDNCGAVCKTKVT